MLERLPKFKMSAFNYKEQAQLFNKVIDQVEANQEEISVLRDKIVELERAKKDLLEMIINPKDEEATEEKPEMEEPKKKATKKKDQPVIEDVPPIDLT